MYFLMIGFDVIERKALDKIKNNNNNNKIAHLNRSRHLVPIISLIS